MKSVHFPDTGERPKVTPALDKALDGLINDALKPPDALGNHGPAIVIGQGDYARGYCPQSTDPVSTSTFEAQLRGSVLLPLIREAIKSHAGEWAKQIAVDVVKAMEPGVSNG